MKTLHCNMKIIFDIKINISSDKSRGKPEFVAFFVNFVTYFIQNSDFVIKTTANV